MVDHGVEALTTRDIARPPGCRSRRSTSTSGAKEDVLLALAERDMAEMDEQVMTDLARSRSLSVAR